jgi:hypothetical protein
MAIIKPEQLSSGTYSISGSFSGSFHGDGSDLNNLPSNIISTGSYADFPSTGSEGYIYIDNSANIGYLWDSGSIPPTYVNIAGPSTPPDVIPLAFANAATLLALSPSPLYDNGVSGSGAVLTGSINGTLSDSTNPGKIDYTYTPVVGDVILVKNQLVSTNPTLNKAFQNGLYTITSTGSASSKYVLTRTGEYDVSSELYPLQVNVLTGTNNAARSFIQTTINPVIGTSNLVFAASSASPSVAPQIAFVDTVIDTPLTNIIYATGSIYALMPGAGATLTSTVSGSLGTWNGLSVNTNQNITGSFTKALVINQTNPAYNGDYSVLATGSNTVFWKLQRINNSSGGFNRYTRFFLVSNTSSSKAGRMYFTSPNSPALTDATIGTAPINIFEYGGGGSGSSTPAFPFTGSALITGSLGVTGSVSSTQGFTGSLLGTASLASTASFVVTAQTASYVLNAQTASYVITAQTASYVLNAVSSSFATTASYALNALSASYAPNTTFPYTGSALITGSLGVTGSISSYDSITLLSNATYLRGVNSNNIQTRMMGINSLNLLYIGSIDAAVGSILFNISGSTLMQISSSGDIGIGKLNPTAKLDVNGNTIITGSLKVTAGITGSLFGTSSFATTASYALNALSASYAPSVATAVGPFGIANSSGSYTYYTSFSASMAAAPTGSTVEMFADVVETGAVTITLKNGVNINGNGHTYTYTNNSGNVFADSADVNGTFAFYNINITRTNTTSTGAVIFAFTATSVYAVSKIDFSGCVIRYTVTSGNSQIVSTDALKSTILNNINCITNGSGTAFIGTGANSNLTLNNSYIECNGTSNGTSSCTLKQCIIQTQSGCGVSNSTAIECVVDCITSGIGINASTAYNCTVTTNTGNCFDSTTPSNIGRGFANNCIARTTSGTCYYSVITNGCWGYSATGNALFIHFNYGDGLYKYYNSFFSSGGAIVTNIPGGAYLINCTISSTWSNIGGHAIRISGIGNDSSGQAKNQIINCVIETVNPSSNCVNSTAATDCKYSNNSFKISTTPVNANITQTIINTQDNQGNILL